MLAFNRGHFNRPARKSIFFSGRASMELVSISGTMNTVSNLAGAAELALYAQSGELNTTSLFTGAASLELSASGVINTSSLFSGSADISVRTGGDVTRMRNIGERFDYTRNSKFNRMGFNRGRFNTTASHIRSSANISMRAAGEMFAIRGFNGEAEIMLVTKSGRLNTSSTFAGDAVLSLFADGHINATKPFAGAADLIISAAGQINAMRDFEGAAFLVLQATSQEFNTFRLEYIELPNLTMQVGDELVIDTDAKTITLNGQNIMRHLSRTSEFFNFNPRENEIEYISANPNDQVEIRILWKDAWI